MAKALNAKKHGSNSQYATFEAVNGKVFIIRLANHNAKTSTFDNHDENNGISIVVIAQDNNGITNDGSVHLVEFFYDAIKLRKAEGKPLVEILKSIKQALYIGEYNDNTGLADVQEVNTSTEIEEEVMFSKRMKPQDGVPATEEFINATILASNWGNAYKGAAPCIVIQSAETLRMQLEDAGFVEEDVLRAEKVIKKDSSLNISQHRTRL